MRMHHEVRRSRAGCSCKRRCCCCCPGHPASTITAHSAQGFPVAPSVPNYCLLRCIHCFICFFPVSLGFYMTITSGCRQHLNSESRGGAISLPSATPARNGFSPQPAHPLPNPNKPRNVTTAATRCKQGRCTTSEPRADATVGHC